MIYHIIKLIEEEFFSNKILNTLNTISEMCAIDQPRTIFLEYYFLQILGEAPPHLPHPQNHH
jgi:hypothetical protein